MNRLISTFVAFALVVVAPAVWAEDVRAERVSNTVADTLAALELSEQQAAEVEPLLREAALERQKILEAYGLDAASRESATERPARRQLRAMRNEMQEVNDATTEQLDTLLNDEQMAAYQQLLKERQSAMRDRLRGSR